MRGIIDMSAHDILQQAAKHMQDRAATYDKPEGERSMGATVVAFNAVTGISMNEEQGWLFMSLLKAVRSQQGAYRADSYEDGAAYFALAGEAGANARHGGYDRTAVESVAFNRHPATPNVWDEGEKRIDIVAASGGQGEHYGLNCGGASFEESADFEPVQHISDTDGAGVWTVHDGVECPVDAHAWVEVMFRDGETEQSKAVHFAWHHQGFESDIIRYRLL